MYNELIKKMNIKKGENIFIASDILRIGLKFYEKKETFDLDIFLDKLKEKITKEGTIVFPTYNWDFCKGISFDYNKTKSKTGALSQKALKRKEFQRTQHPIYSFAVWGKNSQELCNLNNSSSFGLDSPFSYFKEKDYKMVFIDVSFTNSLTFTHYIEESLKVDYRFLKTFKGKYIDKNNSETEREYSMYVRYLEFDVGHNMDKLEISAENKKILKVNNFYNIPIKNCRLKELANIIEKDIKENDSLNIAQYDKNKLKIYKLKEQLFPICRSITGNGLRESLKIISKEIPLNILEIPTGTKAFDWEVPKEWNIKDAYVKDLKGNKIIDFKKSNLHILGYSTPFQGIISHEELMEHIYTLPEIPEAIPYLTSYYKERWGFCLEHQRLKELNQDKYEIFIDSELKNGSMSIGEGFIKGKIDKEVLLSTYLCHPSMGNNELSGPIVQTLLYNWLLERKDKLKYSYRFLYLPETIGSITYLSLFGENLKKNVVAGYVINCIGDRGKFTYKKSRQGNSLADKAALNILNNLNEDFNLYEWFPAGSDERQYCSLGFNLPIGSLMRSMYGTYKEYHTSLDNLDFIPLEELYKSFEIYKKILMNIEINEKLEAVHKNCEPKLDKRGLYPTLGSQKETTDSIKKRMYLWAFSDGYNDVIEIANKLKCNAYEMENEKDELIDKKLIRGLGEKNV
jgi:aminopeptidase-like protein/aminoglycoside N3'-acetyltransferase